MRRLPRRTVLAWAGVSVLGVPACLSPTLPLPPPEAPDGLDIGEGKYRLRGYIPLFGAVFVRNKRTNESVGLWDVLAYQLDVVGVGTDRMVLWYMAGNEVSSPIEFQLNRLTPIQGDGGL